VKLEMIEKTAVLLGCLCCDSAVSGTIETIQRT